MESKRLRRDVARASAEYGRLKEKCLEYLQQKTFFKKDWILHDTGLDCFADSIRWDYIAEWIAEEQDCELSPLAESFFKRKSLQQMRLALPEPEEGKKQLSLTQVAQLLPGRFTASGHGKKTVGYASVTFANGALHFKRLDDRKKLANGLSQSSDKFQQQIERVYPPVKTGLN